MCDHQAGANFTPLTDGWLLDVVDANLQEQHYLNKQREEQEEEMEELKAHRSQDSFKSL